jgi:hypothetical protein
VWEDEAMPQEGPDFDAWKSWCDETFNHLKELFKHEVARHVITRLVGIGSAVVTLVGVLSYFGFQQIIKNQIDTALIQAKNEVKEEIKADVDKQVIKEVERQLEKMNDLTEKVQLNIAEGMGMQRLMREDFKAARSKLMTSLDELDEIDVKFEGIQEKLRQAESRITKVLGRSNELVSLDSLEIEQYIDRIGEARRRLAFAERGSNEYIHEKVVLQRCIDNLGRREFKESEKKQKKNIIKFLGGLLEATPREDRRVVLRNDDFRVARNKVIFALNNLSSNPPSWHYGIDQFAIILDDRDGKYLERDGAAWGLHNLASEAHLTETSSIIKRSISRAVEALVKAAITEEDTEITRVAMESLRKIVRTPAFKDLELDPILGTAVNKTKVGGQFSRISQMPPLNSRLTKIIDAEIKLKPHAEKAMRIAAILAGSGQSYWSDFLKEIIIEDKYSEDVRQIAAKYLLQINSYAALNALKETPQIKKELRQQVERAEWREIRKLDRKRKASFEQGNHEDAIAAVQQIIQINPGNLSQIRNLVELYLIAGEYDKALQRTTELRKKTKGSGFNALYDWFDAAGLVLQEENYQNQKDQLCQSAKRNKITDRIWRFSIFQNYINEYKEEYKSKIDELVEIAQEGNC